MGRAGAFGPALALVAAVMAAGPGKAQMLRFSDLAGWENDDHAAALATFRETCDLLDGPDWSALCSLAADVTDARRFFELFFRPVRIGDDPALFTGYYEPELRGSLTPDHRYAHPVFRPPPELDPGDIWHTRQEIEENGLLRGRGLEIAWLEDPVEAFFLQIQGSGRIRLPDGGTIRLGYAAKNNRPYRSIGAELVRRGIYAPHQVSAQVIRSWVRRNPAEGRALLHHNPSFVFFRVLPDLPAHRGPVGAMGRSVTAGRSIAVDPAFHPLGAPVWIEKDGAAPMHRLMIAQDVGGAITGAQRADIFYGTGHDAGEAAGRIRDRGRLVTLLPIELAYALLDEG